MKYNPPPNWPAPPAGWVPPPGWQPDPAWGPSPSDWHLWVEEKNGRSWPARHKAGTAGIAFGILLVIAGIIGAVNPSPTTPVAAVSSPSPTPLVTSFAPLTDGPTPGVLPSDEVPTYTSPSDSPTPTPSVTVVNGQPQFNDKGFTLTHLKLTTDITGDEAATAILTNTNDDTETATFTVSIVASDGSVLATLNGIVNSLGPGASNTVDLSSLNAAVHTRQGVTFQVDTSFPG